VHLSSRKPPEPRNGGNVSPFILPRQLRARFVCASLEPRLVCPRGPYPENQAVRPRPDSCPFQKLASGLHGEGVPRRLGKGTATKEFPSLYPYPFPPLSILWTGNLVNASQSATPKPQKLLYTNPRLAEDGPQRAFGDLLVIRNGQTSVGRVPVAENDVASRAMILFVA